MRKGIDVSAHQGRIDWQKVRESGVDFAILRAANGGNVDKAFLYNAAQCEAIGIPWGAYYYSHAENALMARREAKALISFVNSAGAPTMPLFIDWEDSELVRRFSATDVAFHVSREFCLTLEDSGFFAGIYTNKSMLISFYPEFEAKRHLCWLADWTGEEHLLQAAEIVQYSNKGRVSGISGDVDLCCTDIDYPKMIAERFKK